MTDHEEQVLLALAVRECAEAFGVASAGVADMTKRDLRHVWARQSTAYLARSAGVRLVTIGLALGASGGVAQTRASQCVKVVSDRLSVPRWDRVWCAAHKRATERFAVACAQLKTGALS